MVSLKGVKHVTVKLMIVNTSYGEMMIDNY